MADVKSVLATPGAAHRRAGAPHLDVEVQLPDQALKTLVSFLAGGAYGLTSVAVGQPLDTVKTRMSGAETGAWKDATG
eukprot:Skav230930  [mRNA]  locus=scaffold2774:41785:43082:- [translate_table: standard]